MGVGEIGKDIGAFELQHEVFSRHKKPARGGFDEGDWGFLKDRF